MRRVRAWFRAHARFLDRFDIAMGTLYLVMLLGAPVYYLLVDTEHYIRLIVAVVWVVLPITWFSLTYTKVTYQKRVHDALAEIDQSQPF